MAASLAVHLGDRYKGKGILGILKKYHSIWLTILDGVTAMADREQSSSRWRIGKKNFYSGT
jgi:hypothetical protein